MYSRKIRFSKQITLEALINSAVYSLIGALMAAAIWFAWFFYQNFYVTIGRAETVLILKSELALDVLDVPLYEKIKTEMERSNATPASSATSTEPARAFDTVPNPFVESPSPIETGR